MNRIFFLSWLAVLALALNACQKQPTDADRNAEVERQVQQRLDAEHQAAAEQTLAQRQADLDAREQALAAKENRPAVTAAPVATAKPLVRATAPNDSDNRSYATFYRKLAPYGDWIETGDYGYVFQPQVAARENDWRPYTRGHWVYTDAGWTWISDEQFGWATYHYGRWIRLRNVGWVWAPGEQWAPAWVSWRKGGDYIGWAPLPPEAHFDRDTGIRNWADNYYGIGPDQYAFVRANDFGAKVSAHVVVPTQQNVTIINQTTNVTNITYNNSIIVDRGPSYDDLRSRSSQPIERFRLERTQDTANERPVIRGQVVAVPTLDFRPAEQAARPPRVTRTIAQPVAERGWSDIHNQEAAEKARAKMKAEATPPPNLPPRRVVRPEPAATVAPRSSPAKIGRAVSPTVSNGPAIPVGTPAPLPDNPLPAPSTPVPSPSVAPTRPPRPTAAPESTKNNPAATAASPDRNPRAAARAAQEAQRKERQAQQAQRQAERQQQMKNRQNAAPKQTPPAASASPVPVETTTATTEPSATQAAGDGVEKKNAAAQRRARQAERRAKKNQPEPTASPSPTPPAP